MDTKFTSGKWSQSHRKDKKTGMYSTEVYDSRGQTICTLAWHTEPESTRTDRPENAALIAAAPDMYKLLNDMFENHELGEGVDHDIYELLKKARGES